MRPDVFELIVYRIFTIPYHLPAVFCWYLSPVNLFNPSTVIRYQLPVESKVTLKIYNVLGQEVETAVDAVQQAGNYSIPFDASRISSGVYIYKIIAGASTGSGFVDVKRMLIMK